MFIYLVVFSLIYCCDGSLFCGKSETTCSGTSAPHKICSQQLIFEDNFDRFDFKKWQHEITLAGGGNWEFQWYTNNRSNSFTKDGKLFIKPTLTSDTIGEENLSKMTLDIIGSNPADMCTNPNNWGCLRTGTEQYVLNPIKSAKIRTEKSFSFKYGTVEVRAKLPAGDWLWPAIWLLPKYEVYGNHPASGEIDVMESRGNKNLVLNDVNIGTEQISSTLHWGPDGRHNAFPKTNYMLRTSNKSYDEEFKKYQMKWTPEYLMFSVDDVHVGTTKINTSFWEFGNFTTNFENPWRFGSKMAPFDDEFYIIINLAVGGVNGYFPDDAKNPTPKPWKNTSPTAATDFWNGRKDWLPTWKMDVNEGESSSFQIDYVKVWAL